MLILERKLGERIIIDNNIYLTVLSITKRHIKIGIEAPKEIMILREELLKNMEKFNNGEVKEG
jgi:carbon storage regulator